MSFFSLGFLIISVLLISGTLTGAMRGYAMKRLLDLPNARSSHQIPTPRGGGLAVVLSFTLASAGLYWLGQIAFELFMLVLGALPIAAIGFWDDHGHVSARWRLIVQIASAAWSLYWLDGLESIRFASEPYEVGWLGPVFAIFLAVWLLNLFNFMDGIDGIAGIEVVSVAMSSHWLLVYQSPPLLGGASAILLTLAAAVGGFLCWNWPPAKIFMGDVGSAFVGFVLAVLALQTSSEGTLSLAVWLILVGVFFVDATVTLLRRMLSGQRWYEAHRSHAYQHAARRWSSHKRVSLSVLAINLCWLLPLAFAAVRWPQLEPVFLVCAYTPLIALALWLEAGKQGG
ncbi:glycosyltransferase family 4 protein [Methylocaldum sp.]|uniref:MraY family glycosyltransferase n=1 Tax=Methylocaldum sp. TaxID=1969727 RepID=UPI002D5E7BAC|nr:glycosyltransferase family 4 protein [Methylocaldum sp.]HYE37582.1 glycosyltransferase family 4 protein [Methylocaldum sp.]